ncbi:MAG TPA: tyrosine-type recombinase/integrase, partial [Candidatus Deferrimicrobiaceae bacterium]|nr:tyrosine-type recombinase/integrase [Candidatus Deferrimicrobiaceae bacterium]
MVGAMDIDVLADGFLLHLRTERRLSGNTVDSYGFDMRRFVSFLVAAGVGLPDFSRSHFLAFLSSLRDEGLSARSVARHVSTVRSFFRYLVREGKLTASPIAEARGPKTGRPLPKYLTLSEVERLLSAPDGKTPEGMRDRAMLELLYASGLRASEVVSLRLENVDVHAGFLRVIGKGGKERVVPIAEPALETLLSYIKEWRPRFLKKKGAGNVLFLSRLGRPITRQTLWSRIGKWAGEAGIRERISPHTLRH